MKVVLVVELKNENIGYLPNENLFNALKEKYPNFKGVSFFHLNKNQEDAKQNNEVIDALIAKAESERIKI